MWVAWAALCAAWVMAMRRSERCRSVTKSPASTVSHICWTVSNRNARPDRSLASASPILAWTIGRSRSRSDDIRGTLTCASSTNSSMAARATPRPTQQKPQPARSKPCIRFIGPVTRARRSSAENVCSSGTNRSSTSISWLPVPRMPLTFQVSMILTCDFG